MRAIGLVLRLLALATPALGLFADQLGQGDWIIENIGIPERVLAHSKWLYVSTSSGIVAALNARTGAAEWRHFLPSKGSLSSSLLALSQDSQYLFTASTDGKSIRRWRAKDGALMWDAGTLSASDDGSVAMVEADGALATLVHNSVNVFSSQDGSLTWHVSHFELADAAGHANLLEEYSLDMKAIHRTAPNKLVALGDLKANGKISAVLSVQLDVSEQSISAQVFRVNGDHEWSADGFTFGFSSNGLSGLVLSASGNALGVLSPAGDFTVSHIETTNQAPFLSGSLTLMENSGSQLFTVRTASQSFALRVEADGLRVVGQTNGELSASFTDSSLYLFTADIVSPGSYTLSGHTVNDDGTSVCLEHSELEYSDAAKYGPLTGLFTQVFSKREGGIGVRALTISQAHTLNYVSIGNKPLWTRNEALASVKEIQFVDRYKPSETDPDAGLSLPSFEERLALHKLHLLNGLQLLLDSLQNLPTLLLKPHSGTDAIDDITTVAAHSVVGSDGFTPSMRHKFGLDRVAVCLTDSGLLIGLALESGNELWSILLDHDDYKLVSTRPKHVGGFHPELIAVRQTGTGTTEVLTIDGFHGKFTEEKRSIPFPMTSLTSLGISDAQFREVHFAIGAEQPNGQLDVFLLNDSDRARKAIQNFNRKPFVHVVNKASGVLQSYLVDISSPNKREGTTAFEAYPIASAILASSDETLVATAYPSFDDHISSRAQILGDDSLLLKYTNPHLMVTLTESMINATTGEPSTAPGATSVVFVSLVDTVSARVLHRVTHLHASAKRAVQGGKQLVMSENWVMYHYWNVKAKRTELGVLSLYEGMIDKYGLNPFNVPAQEGNFSSFNAQPPVVMQRTYIFPRGISSIEPTVTARGLSTKNLMVAMETGQVVQLHRRMLDPRRPNKEVTKNERQEGLMQYSAFLFPHPQAMVTANRTVLGLKDIYSSPAIIESTSLVVATGVDVFFMRTTPSKTFDMLAADFNRPMLLLLLGGFAIGVFSVSRMEHKKRLSSAWQ